MPKVNSQSVQELQLGSVQSQQKIKVWARKPESLYESMIWDLEEASVNHFMSLWSETWKRYQSKFSASTSLTETSKTYEWVLLKNINKQFLSIKFEYMCIFVKFGKEGHIKHILI